MNDLHGILFAYRSDSRLGELICEVKKRCEQPVCVITNGILLSDPQIFAIFR